MADRLKKTDVVIVGLGAGGGIASYVLAKAGLKLVALEAGGRFTGRDEQLNELGESGHYNIRGRAKFNQEIPTWRPDASTPTIPGSATPGALPMMNAVGGSSLHYGTQSFRLVQWNFAARSETIKRYGAGAIPAGSTVADWPFGYRDLEHYYDEVEHLIGISGKAGNIRGRHRPGGNPFEGPRARAYPLPPLNRSGFVEILSTAAQRLGWHPYPGPSSVHSRPFKGTPACTYCGFCHNGCWGSMKGSTDIHAIPLAEATHNLKVVTHARATHIDTDKHGRVTGVHYLKGGRMFFQPASVVLLASYTYENSRLLLLSRSKAYPHGLSNNHGQVGKHYMAETGAGASANGLLPGQKLNRFSGLVAQSTQVDDWADDNFDHSGLGFIGGATLQGSMELKPIAAANTTPPSIASWGSAWKAWLQANANSVASVVAQAEMLPYEDNYLDLDPVARDSLGFPVIRATFSLKENELRSALFQAEKLTAWLQELGATEVWTAPPSAVGTSSHAYGGTRMGDDPATSVVNRWCLSHEAPNLGIVGASTFPTTGCHNPTLTVQAVAWRTAEHLVKNWKSIAA